MRHRLENLPGTGLNVTQPIENRVEELIHGVVMVSYFNELRRRGQLVEHAVVHGAALGLVPMLFASGPGSEIQKPLAAVVIGGLVSSTLLTLIVLPVLYTRFERSEPTARQ